MSNPANQQPIDPDVEARLVAMILGEASDLEAAQVRQLLDDHPELQPRYQQLCDLHASLLEIGNGDWLIGDDQDWQLPPERRQQVLSVLSNQVSTTSVHPVAPAMLAANVNIAKRWYRSRFALGTAAAACLLLCASLMLPTSRLANRMVATGERAPATQGLVVQSAPAADGFVGGTTETFEFRNGASAATPSSGGVAGVELVQSSPQAALDNLRSALANDYSAPQSKQLNDLYGANETVDATDLNTEFLSLGRTSGLPEQIPFYANNLGAHYDKSNTTAATPFGGMAGPSNSANLPMPGMGGYGGSAGSGYGEADVAFGNRGGEMGSGGMPGGGLAGGGGMGEGGFGSGGMGGMGGGMGGMPGLSSAAPGSNAGYGSEAPPMPAAPSTNWAMDFEQAPTDGSVHDARTRSLEPSRDAAPEIAERFGVDPAVVATEPKSELALNLPGAAPNVFFATPPTEQPPTVWHKQAAEPQSTDLSALGIPADRPELTEEGFRDLQRGARLKEQLGDAVESLARKESEALLPSDPSPAQVALPRIIIQDEEEISQQIEVRADDVGKLTDDVVENAPQQMSAAEQSKSDSLDSTQLRRELSSKSRDLSQSKAEKSLESEIDRVPILSKNLNVPNPQPSSQSKFERAAEDQAIESKDKSSIVLEELSVAENKTKGLGLSDSASAKPDSTRERMSEFALGEVARGRKVIDGKASGIDGEPTVLLGGIRARFDAKKSNTPPSMNEVSAEDEAFSTFSLHVSDVSFKLASSALNAGQWPEANQVRLEEFVNALDYHDPLPSSSEHVSCSIDQSQHPYLIGRNLLRVSMQTAATGRTSGTPLRLTLLLDHSGSMERPDRRETVQRAFAALVAQLKPQDQITLVSFASEPRLLADNITVDRAHEISQMIDSLPSEGGTNIEAALTLAMQKASQNAIPGAQNRIVMLTDGAVNLGNANPESLSKLVLKMRDAGIAFDAAGISAQDLNDEVLESLTRQGDGRYYLLDSAESVEDGFAKQIAGALRPSAKNVKVQIEFNPQRVGRYKLLGYEKHMLKKEDFRNDRVDAAEMAAAEAGVAVYQYEVKPDGQGDIGSASVRFQDLATGQMIEKRWPIPYEPNAPRIDQAAPALRMATAAALLASKLRGDALAGNVDLRSLSTILADLPATYAGAQRVQQLRTMIQQAQQIGGSTTDTAAP